MNTTCKNPTCKGGIVLPTASAGGLRSMTQPTGVCNKCGTVHRWGQGGWFLTSGKAR